MFKVIFYQDRSGNEPIKDFLLDLSQKAQSSKNDRIQFNKINAYIKALQAYGTRIGKPSVKHIDGDLWELRPLENRIFFFYWRGNTFVLLHHFIKKSQKTPMKEIEQARTNPKDFLERIDDNER
ncbi:MAG: type II toxin-antitoxin system RelE/ParE family toxin [Eubacteriales bacterium]|nr:type II toxin-antitoxin system RelE/ParE family toxin [Eubacteriales bacterium]